MTAPMVDRCHPIHMSKASVLLLLAALAPLGCNSKEVVTAPQVYVQATHPERGSVSDQIVADAILTPLAQAAISPKISAPVKRFYVQRGSRVEAGQLLATLENADLAAAALDNQGAYTAAQATYATAIQSTVPANYITAQQDLAQAKATLDLNQSIVTARTQLFAQGAIPGRDLDTAKAILVQSQAAYDIAQQHFEALKKVTNQAAIQNAKGTLQSAKGKYLGAQALLNYTEIRSPIKGVVTDRPLFAGESAAAGTPLLTVMDTSALIAKLHIAQRQAQQLILGAAATIAVPGIEEPMPAKVSLISPALDPGSTTVEVWLRLENPKSSFKAGTPVQVSITGITVPNALLIPTAAIQAGSDGTTRFVTVIASDSTAQKRIVTLGIQTPDETQILSGLSLSDLVITDGGYGLDDGTKVKIGTDPNAKPDTGDAKPAGGKDAGNQ